MTNPNPASNTQMQQLIDAITQMKSAVDMQTSLLSGQGGGTSVFSQMDHRLQQLVQYVQYSTQGGAPGAAGIGGYGRTTAPSNQTHRPPPAWGGNYPGGLADVRKNAARILDNVAGSGSGDAYVPTHKNAAGNQVYAHLRNGQLLGHRTVGTGPGQVTQAQLAASAGTSRIAAVAQHAGGGPAGGGLKGLVNSIPVVGPIASRILGIGEDILNFGMSAIGVGKDQISAGRNYQAIYGGGIMPNQGERAIKAAATLQNKLSPTGLDDQDFETAYDSITAMGYKAGSRRDKMAFVRNAYESTGARPGETLPFLDQVARGANINLKDLTKSLQEVSEAAAKAGQSGVVFRKQMADLTQRGLDAGYSGNAAVDLAKSEIANTGGARNLVGSGYNTDFAHQNIAAYRAGMPNGGYMQLYSTAHPHDKTLSKANDALLRTTMTTGQFRDIYDWTVAEMAYRKAKPKDANDAKNKWIAYLFRTPQGKQVATNYGSINPPSLASIIAYSGGEDLTGKTLPDLVGYLIYQASRFAPGGTADGNKAHHTGKVTVNAKNGDITIDKPGFINVTGAPTPTKGGSYSGGGGGLKVDTPAPAPATPVPAPSGGGGTWDGGPVQFAGDPPPPSGKGHTVKHVVELGPKAARALQVVDDPSNPKTESGAKSNSPVTPGQR